MKITLSNEILFDEMVGDFLIQDKGHEYTIIQNSVVDGLMYKFQLISKLNDERYFVDYKTVGKQEKLKKLYCETYKIRRVKIPTLYINKILKGSEIFKYFRYDIRPCNGKVIDQIIISFEEKVKSQHDQRF